MRDGDAQPLADLGDPAAEDDVLGIDREADQADGVGDPGREPVPDLHRARITGSGGVEERLRGRDALTGQASATAEPDAAVSRQPTWPHWHSRPPGSTGTWPISPAALRIPRRNRPSRIDAAASPVPRLR